MHAKVYWYKQAFVKHVDFSVVRCAVIASPGFTKVVLALQAVSKLSGLTIINQNEAGQV